MQKWNRKPVFFIGTGIRWNNALKKHFKATDPVGYKMKRPQITRV